MAAPSPPIAVRVRRTQGSAARASCSPLEAQTVVARLPSPAAKKIGTKARSSGRHSGIGPAAAIASAPSAAAPHPSSACSGVRQSRRPSVTIRRPTSIATTTAKATRSIPPLASVTPARVATIAAANGRFLDVRKRHASSAPTTYAATNGTASSSTSRSIARPWLRR